MTGATALAFFPRTAVRWLKERRGAPALPVQARASQIHWDHAPNPAFPGFFRPTIHSDAAVC